LYGTWVQVTPVIDRNSSPARCVKLPLPAEATLIAPGFALASAINSPMFFTGRDGLTMTTIGVDATIATGARSLSGS
jgi:hypothetical protein